MAAKWFSSPIAIERLALTVTFLFGYMALIVNLSCLPVSSAALVDEGVLTLGQLGNIFAASNGAVVAGKIINGGLSDFLGARKTFILTEILVPLFTGMVSLSHNWVVILFLWCFVRFCHSAAWPAIAKLIHAWYSNAEHGQIWGVVGTISRFSSLISTLLIGLMLLHLSWRWAFFNAALLQMSPLFLSFLFIKNSPPKNNSFFEKEDPETHGVSAFEREEDLQQRKPVASQIIFFLKSPPVQRILIAHFFVMMSYEFFISFSVLYLTENFGLSASLGGILSFTFPLGAMAGIIMGGKVHDHLTNRQRTIFFTVLSGLSFASNLGCTTLILFDDFTSQRLIGAIILLFVTGFCFTPVYYLPHCVFSIQFAGSSCGLLIGLLDCIGYGGAIIFDLVGVTILEEHGWISFLILTDCCVLAAAICTFIFYRYEEKRLRYFEYESELTL